MSRHYFYNPSTLDIGVYSYITAIYPKERSSKVSYILLGNPIYKSIAELHSLITCLSEQNLYDLLLNISLNVLEFVLLFKQIQNNLTSVMSIYIFLADRSWISIQLIMCTCCGDHKQNFTTSYTYVHLTIKKSQIHSQTKNNWQCHIEHSATNLTIHIPSTHKDPYFPTWQSTFQFYQTQ